jgi:hypothetical protein
MDNQTEVLNLSFMQLNDVFNAFFVIYLPVINASMEESIKCHWEKRRFKLFPCYAPLDSFFRAFYDMFVLTARAVLAHSSCTLSGMFIKRSSRAIPSIGNYPIVIRVLFFGTHCITKQYPKPKLDHFVYIVHLLIKALSTSPMRLDLTRLGAMPQNKDQ